MKFALPMVLTVLSMGVSAGAQAGVLVGSATLTSTNDLTLIEVAPGQQLEFLDLSATTGMSADAAVAAWSSYGFHWANNADAAQLFSAFGMAYTAPNPLAGSLVIPSLAAAKSFEQYLGLTYSDQFGNTAAQGFIDDGTDSGIFASVEAKSNVFSSTVILWSAFGGPTPNPPAKTTGYRYAGVFLVRDAAPPIQHVPEPGTLALAAAAAVAAVGLRRRRRPEYER